METACFVAFLGLFLVLVGIGKAIAYDIKVKRYTKIEGEVVDYKMIEVNTADGRFKKYLLKVQYIVNGVSYYVFTKYAKLFEYRAKRCIGNKLTVYYLEDNPEKSLLANDSPAIAYVIIGIIFILPAVILILSIKYLY